MARRRFADASMSRLAVWSRRCAFFSLAATVIAIVIVRSGFLEIVPALATFAGALVFAGFSIMLAFGAFVVIWREGSGGLGNAVMALGIGAALLAYPAYLGAKAYRLPMINDITTDPIDPPRFDVVGQLRAVIASRSKSPPMPGFAGHRHFGGQARSAVSTSLTQYDVPTGISSSLNGLAFLATSFSS